MHLLTTLDEVTGIIGRRAASVPRVIIGLAGQPGSGKSTVAAHVVSLLGPSAQVLPVDGFHLPQAQLVELGRRDRMGAPDTFDVAGFVAVVRGLRQGGSLDVPGFDRVIEEPVPGDLSIAADTRIVLVEGNYLLYEQDGWQTSVGLLDLRLYLDVDPLVRRERLIARHIHFGKSPAAAREWALGPDEANARLIVATAGRADYVVRLDETEGRQGGG